LLTLCFSSVIVADVVVPSSDVTTRVIVRKTATSQSARIGSLEPGQQAELIGTVPNWYEIRLPSSLIGFVPKRWTDVITSGTPAPAPATTQTFTLDAVVNKCGGRNVRCCEETGHKAGACTGAVATKFWTFRWEYSCAPCREYEWCGTKTRGYMTTR